MKFLGERCCVPGSDEMFEIHQRSMCFGCWENLCCSCRIPEVPASRIIFQPVLEAMEVSGENRETMRNEVGFYPLVVQVEGKKIGVLELAVSFDYERGTLASLMDHRPSWIHIPNSMVSFYWEMEQKGYGWEEHSSSAVGCTFYKISVLMCCVCSWLIVVQFTMSYIG
jgi:hypothetical protein